MEGVAGQHSTAETNACGFLRQQRGISLIQLRKCLHCIFGSRGINRFKQSFCQYRRDFCCLHRSDGGGITHNNAGDSLAGLFRHGHGIVLMQISIADLIQQLCQIGCLA